MPPAPLTFVTRLYQALTFAAAPLAMRAARRRFIATNAPLDRLRERNGHASKPRPQGSLVWMHTVSVGEFLSVLDLVREITEAGHQVLVTTTTGTAAALAEKRLPDGALHQFSPIDTPQAVRRFLSHWKPDLAVFVESEIWPNQILQARARDIPLALINARLSAKSLTQWQKLSATARALFTRFDCILCQVRGTEQALELLGAPRSALRTTGDMKAASAPLPFEADEAAKLKAQIGARAIWVASSTHPGEEPLVTEAHRAVTTQYSDALQILVPRHPDRGDEIEAQLRSEGWTIARRSRGETPAQDTQIYLADTLGETGLWYHLAPITFIAGSFTPVGGHNPYEPAHFDCAILHGPQYANFRLAYGEMKDHAACLEVADVQTLGTTVARLLKDPQQTSLADNARAYVASAQNIRQDVLRDLLDLMK